jgi:hypothetical protein
MGGGGKQNPKKFKPVPWLYTIQIENQFHQTKTRPHAIQSI